MYKNILVPIDDHEQSYAAVRVAGMIAACNNSGITLFHVRKPSPVVVTDMITEDKLFDLPLQEQDTRMFEQCRDILSSFKIEPKVMLVASHNAAREIINECRTGAYNNIVMGSSRRNALLQLILGSLAIKVIKGSACPVITVHIPGHYSKINDEAKPETHV